MAIAEQFAQQVRQAASTPLIVVLPDARAARARLDVLDLGPSFGRTVIELGAARICIRQRHHAPESNRLIAAAIEEPLRPGIETGGGNPAPPPGDCCG